jgi:hypothetical protein
MTEIQMLKGAKGITLTKSYHIRLRETVLGMLNEKIRHKRKMIYKNSKQFTYQAMILDKAHQLVNFILSKKRMRYLSTLAENIYARRHYEMNKSINII